SPATPARSARRSRLSDPEATQAAQTREHRRRGERQARMEGGRRLPGGLGVPPPRGGDRIHGRRPPGGGRHPPAWVAASREEGWSARRRVKIAGCHLEYNRMQAHSQISACLNAADGVGVAGPAPGAPRWRVDAGNGIPANGREKETGRRKKTP